MRMPTKPYFVSNMWLFNTLYLFPLKILIYFFDMFIAWIKHRFLKFVHSSVHAGMPTYTSLEYEEYSS